MFSFEDDGEFDLFDLWEQKNKEFGTIKKSENPTRDGEHKKNSGLKQSGGDTTLHIKKLHLLLSAVAVVIICVVVGVLSYSKGFTDNQPYASDGSPVVYITKNGTKYHRKNCDYLTDSTIGISYKQAEENGFSACSKCKPERGLK